MRALRRFDKRLSHAQLNIGQRRVEGLPVWWP